MSGRIEAHRKEVLESMLSRGMTAYRADLVGAASYLSAALLVFVIALVFSLHWVFYIFAAVLLVAAIRSWLNMRDMERFIDTVRRDILEIRK